MKRFLRFLFVMMGIVSGGLCFYLFSTPILQYTKIVGELKLQILHIQDIVY